MILAIIIDLLVGAFCGWLITNLMKMDSSNLIFNCGLGLLGGFVGGLLGNLIGLGPTNLFGSIILAVLGGCVVIWLYRKFIAK